MATPQVKDLVLRSPAGSDVVTYNWPLQTGSGSDKHDNGIDIIETIRLVCDDVPEILSAFEDFSFNDIDTACYKTMSNLVDRFNKAVEGILALEKGTSLPAQRLNKFASPVLLRHILQLVYNAAVIDPDKLNQYEPFSPEVYGETSYELVQQMIEQVEVKMEDTFIDLGSGVGQVVLQMAGSSPLKSCIGIEKAEVPSRYSELMDANFRLWMNWFGKKYGEYQLIKGDFLADEHREKINTSTIVFVNNFAFGPNVDHQLKERFADLRDGARIVSSKSFCPLNFRITDRNLSDIGTIMHVSEMSPLKGSVSWTGKPVSYYLHIIDRTKLERYFQRLKNQKGAENDAIGASTRSSRERGKRSNGETSKTQAMDESSTESDGEVTGPTTRRAWSDWCSSKGKSSQSDDEENNNFSTNSARNGRTGNQKKRKKLTRKATNSSIGNKNGEKPPPAEKPQKPKRGRIKKGRGRRNLKIVGLDALHTQTLLSTSSELMSKKLPPAPGCVDQQLTSLTGDMCHEELDIPAAPAETPYALQILLDMYKAQYMQALDYMKSKAFKENINKQIEREKERNQKLLNRASQLEKQIKVLIDDSVALLKARMNELGISMTSQNDLLAKAKEIVGRHKELQVMAAKLQNQVNAIEQEQKSLVMRHVQNIAEKYVKQKNGENLELTPATSHELVLKEIANTLAQRKKLHAQVSNLENEIIMIEKVNEERKAAAAILAQQSPHLTVTVNHHSSSSSSSSSSSKSSSHSKTSRRSREHRSRSQEWPDVPDVGKIEENNPEILAQKILETGRQIEAGKFVGAPNTAPAGYKQKDERKGGLPHNGDSALMPAPPAAVKTPQSSLHVPQASSRNSSSSKNSSFTNVTTSIPTSKLMQESPKVVNFEDRLKSIITSVLNEDQEQRKAALQTDRKPNPPTTLYNNSANKSIFATNSSNSTSSHLQQQQQQQQQQQHAKDMSNILTVVTQGLTHLNSTTTISPVTPPPFSSANNSSQMPSYKSSTPLYNTSKHPMVHNTPGNSLNNNQQKFYSKNLTINVSSGAQAPHAHHSPSTALLYAAAAAAAAQQQAVADLTFRRSMEHGDRIEFKAPDMRYEKHGQQIEENARSSSASSDSAMYYSTNRDRLHMSGSQPVQQPSRPSSSSSQPDYTQVSPAKMALRRHLSQEKLAHQHPLSHGTMMATKTIGDLVNGEIERTLEISHQSIINAAVNMSTVGSVNGPAMINPNVQRPERVNVRLLDESSHHSSLSNPCYSPISRPNSCESRKSPVHLHGQSNLATLAHVAYNHKMMSQQQTPQSHLQPGNGGQSSTSSRPSNHMSGSSRSAYPNSTVVYQQHQPAMRNQNTGREPYPTVSLPRAEMKPYLESYFTEDQKPPIEERNSRMMNGNPPLEGLAASLQARVIASLKIKEENEERQRRSEMNYPCTTSSNVTIIQTSQIKTEAGMKRTSPIVQHSRPAKIGHYEMHDQLIHAELNHSGRQVNSSMEPPLMSPEINSLTSDERTGQNSRQRNDDDDVLPDDETHWKDCVSSGFDRLVAFASTELDKTRRSIENDTAPSISCNTSPDSGITHSSNSDARTFLSSSSSSSQLDIPISITNGTGQNLNDRQIGETVPIIKTSPTEAIESPPLSEGGLPRTPSPSATPPLIAAAPQSSIIYTSSASSGVGAIGHQTLKIPLKYQRQSKVSEKHYKKKFRERTWEYDYDDYGYEVNANLAKSTSGINPAQTESTMHHKASKFRPKGKDWDWSSDGKGKSNHEDATIA